MAAIVVVAGCGGGTKRDPAVEPALSNQAKPPAPHVPAVPTVASADVIAKVGRVPPPLVIIGASGDVRLAAAESWKALDAGALVVGKAAAPVRAVVYLITEGELTGASPAELVERWDQTANTSIDLSVAEPARDVPTPEDTNTDDESGGSGMAMALDEGKMGKLDSERTEGQYKMRRADGTTVASKWALDDEPYAHGNGTPSRIARIAGVVVEAGVLVPMHAVILAPPAVPAVKLVDAIATTRGAIAVTRDGHIRPLRVQFHLRDDDGEVPDHWVEVRVSTSGVIVEAVPDVAVALADVTPATLAATIRAVRSARNAAAEAPVDVLVDPAVTTQRLLDVLVALDDAGERELGLGTIPTGEQLARRGHRIPTLTIGWPSAAGDLGKDEIKRGLRTQQSSLLRCYTRQLAAKPDLAGVVMLQLFITAKGTVSSASASGVDPDVATCIAGVAKQLEFAKPKGGGGVQVSVALAVAP